MTRGAPSRWPFEKPPGSPGTPDPHDSEQAKRYWFYGDQGEVRVPFASMDIMAYSYAGRTTLAKIARELDNGKKKYWKEQAEVVRQRLIDKLWVDERHACFDLDRNGRRLDELVHNNLRCMYYGSFSQQMADDFIREHLHDMRKLFFVVHGQLCFRCNAADFHAVAAGPRATGL